MPRRLRRAIITVHWLLLLPEMVQALWKPWELADSLPDQHFRHAPTVAAHGEWLQHGLAQQWQLQLAACPREAALLLTGAPALQSPTADAHV